jgi:FkbM family methyltransferase
MATSNLKSIFIRYPFLKEIFAPALKVRKNIIYKKLIHQEEILQRLSELMINDPIIEIKEFGGTYALDIRSHLFKRLLLEKEYEPELVDVCKRYINKNKDIIDVGANVGFFSCFFSKQIQNNKVLAIEPTQNALKRLKHNLELNKANENVILFEGVVSDSEGLLEIKTIEGKEEYSSLGGMNHHGIASEKYVTERVKSITLDALIKEHKLDPGFIKIDVEGAEHLVFAGASEVLTQKRPIILSEMCNFLLKKNGSSAAEVINFIEKHDYEVINPSDPKIDPRTADFGDALCFPRELGLAKKHFLK